ncbi:hypothetical protein BDZ91DRAFT_770327 [Kalaharituber pfeilii]|nr:hypothetical protein BDZ91DRAFT_770327 [Kalaharituber pfeilii]
MYSKPPPPYRGSKLTFTTSSSSFQLRSNLVTNLSDFSSSSEKERKSSPFQTPDLVEEDLPPSFAVASSSFSSAVPLSSGPLAAPGPSSAASSTPAPPTYTEKEKNKSSEARQQQSDSEPPPPYTESICPLKSFSFVMAAAGSIITQVQQGGPQLTGLADATSGDENLILDLRGKRFNLSREELLTLPEFVLLSLFPNGLFPDGGSGSFHEDVYLVDYDPACLEYMLDFFRHVGSTIPQTARDSTDFQEVELSAAMSTNPINVLQEKDRAAIIVLREDLDFYVIPPYADISPQDYMEVKRACGRVLLKQSGIFSGLKSSNEAGSTEQHLIEMLTAGGFDVNDSWGHRACEPNKAVICSLALARLRTLKTQDGEANHAANMAQKLILFWRKPARRCWWEGVQYEGVEGAEGKLKVWIRRVWTLEMV